MPSSTKLLPFFLLLPAIGFAMSVPETWNKACSECHGPIGDGHTKIGAERHIKDYTDPKVQAEFTDAGLLKNLMLGIQSSDGKERMPSFKDKLTIPEAKELVALIRSFKK